MTQVVNRAVMPTVPHLAETQAMPDPETDVGMEKLEALGLEHLGSVEVSFGGVCTGGLAQLLGKESHTEHTQQMIDLARDAVETGKGVEAAEEALLRPIAFFIKTDEETGDYIRLAPVMDTDQAPAETAEAEKK